MIYVYAALYVIGIIIACGLSGWLCGVVFYRRGFDDGKAEGWVERFIEEGKAEQSRHGKDGKFTSTRRLAP